MARKNTGRRNAKPAPQKRRKPPYKNDPNLSPGERQVIDALWERGFKMGKCWGTITALAGRCGVRPGMFVRHANALEYWDYIRVLDRPGDTRGNFYYLVEDHQMNIGGQFRLEMPGGRRLPPPRKVVLRSDHRLNRICGKAVDKPCIKPGYPDHIRGVKTHVTDHIRGGSNVLNFRKRKQDNALPEAEAG